jgi:aryl-alcohol dehydrogenase-like predicted oxidoreductase
MDAIRSDTLFAALDEMVKKGTINCHGVALGPAIGWKDEGLEAISKRNISCLQTVYNILEQDPARELMRAAEHHHIGIMVRVPDASGVLTGKVSTNTQFDKSDHRSFRKQEFIIESMQKIENMKPVANSKGWSITELAIKFILSQRQVSVVLPTMISVEEIEEFASLSDGNYLNSSELAQIEEMYERNFYVEPVAK